MSTFNEARAQWQADRSALAERGFVNEYAVSYMTPEMKRDARIAMDALPTLSDDAELCGSVDFHQLR